MRFNSVKKGIRERNNNYIVTDWLVYQKLEFKSVPLKKFLIANNFSAKWKYVVVDIYQAAEIFTNNADASSCFGAY